MASLSLPRRPPAPAFRGAGGRSAVLPNGAVRTTRQLRQPGLGVPRAVTPPVGDASYGGDRQQAQTRDEDGALIAKPAKPRSARRRRGAALTVVCCPSSLDYSGTVDLLRPREHVFEVAQEEGRMTEVLLRAVGYSGRVTTVGVVGGRRNSARSREREGSVLAASSNVAEHRVDTLWDASRVAAEVVAVPGPRGPVSCLFLDIPSITGNDLLIDTVAAIRSLTSVLMSPGRKMRAVIKSRALTQLQETLFHSAKVLENESGAEAARLEAMLERGSPVVMCTEGVDEYRRAALRVLKPGDRVVEFGCHSGTTTRMAAEAVGAQGRVVGVDIGRSIVNAATKATEGGDTPWLSFQVGDAWDCGSAADVVAEVGGRADVVLLDVGGVSGDSGLLEGLALVRQLYSLTRPRVLVVKSACLRQLAGQLQSSQRMFDLEPIQGGYQGRRP
mmetsp:Transcript_43055/g.111628  ORF Transcript_43055/g.111628 Transcript_43055/m.111628 type:complete len:444 (-) Transcript_43055:547-1878(-)|eukprot:jgi/Tetstr1/435409/TSEL_024318.t1